jgi:hypothetical protein
MTKTWFFLSFSARASKFHQLLITTELYAALKFPSPNSGLRGRH